MSKWYGDYLFFLTDNTLCVDSNNQEQEQGEPKIIMIIERQQAFLVISPSISDLYELVSASSQGIVY